MSEQIKMIAEWCAALVGFLGAGLAIYTLVRATVRLLKKDPPEGVSKMVRQSLGRSILLGLEFLVAADIIHTVAVELTFKTVAVYNCMLPKYSRGITPRAARQRSS